MSYKPLFSSDCQPFCKGNSIEILKERSGWMKYQDDIQNLTALFRKFACHARWESPIEFSKAANYFVRNPKSGLQIKEINVEFPIFSETYQRTDYETATFHAVGTDSETAQNSEKVWELRGCGVIKTEIVGLAEAARPPFNSAASYIGDLIIDQITFPHRESHLKRTTGIPIAMYSPENFTFVSAHKDVAEKILHAMQSVNAPKVA